MAFYIIIDKLSESEEDVIYTFHDTAFPDDIGELCLDKSDGKVSHTKGSNRKFFERASFKVSKSFINGALPDQLCWAS